jgi:hypothetical protein
MYPLIFLSAIKVNKFSSLPNNEGINKPQESNNKSLETLNKIKETLNHKGGEMWINKPFIATGDKGSRFEVRLQSVNAGIYSTRPFGVMNTFSSYSNEYCFQNGKITTSFSGDGKVSKTPINNNPKEVLTINMFNPNDEDTYLEITTSSVEYEYQQEDKEQRTSAGYKTKVRSKNTQYIKNEYILNPITFSINGENFVMIIQK